MGNIKPTFIKRGAERLLKDHPSELSEDFEKNQEVVRKYIIANKFIRNKIAGYLSRKVRNKGKKRTYVPKKPDKKKERDGRGRGRGRF